MGSGEVCVLGYFPPPMTGQAVATRQLALMLATRTAKEPARAVHRIDLADGAHVGPRGLRAHVARVRHHLAMRRHMREALAAAPGATVLWASISPRVLGHLRDVLVVARELRGRDVVAVVHWGDFDRVFRARRTRWTARRLVRGLLRVVFLSPQLAEACAPWIAASQRAVIPNTVDRDTLLSHDEVAAKQRARAGRRELRLLFLASMFASKGYRDLLEATRLLRAGGTAVRVDFAGAWPDAHERAEFDRRVDAGGLSECVVHHGLLVERARVRALLDAADALVLPSYYAHEAQPLAMIEALGAGVPVIASTHTSRGDVVRDGHEGYLVAPRAPRAIAAAVARLVPLEHWLALSRAARDRFDRVFHPDVVRAQWLRLLVGPIEDGDARS